MIWPHILLHFWTQLEEQIWMFFWNAIFHLGTVFYSENQDFQIWTNERISYTSDLGTHGYPQWKLLRPVRSLIIPIGHQRSRMALTGHVQPKLAQESWPKTSLVDSNTIGEHQALLWWSRKGRQPRDKLGAVRSKLGNTGDNGVLRGTPGPYRAKRDQSWPA